MSQERVSKVETMPASHCSPYKPLISEQKLVKKTVRLPIAISQEIDKKDKPAVFLRQSIVNQIEKDLNTKTGITVQVALANTDHYSHEFSVHFHLKGSMSFREQIGDFVDAIQNLQKAITRLDP